MEYVCANCGHRFEGVYCNQCGQKWNVPPFTFAHIFEEGFHAFTHADKSFLAFVKKLFRHPGTVAREYIIERKRKQYYNPFTFFLLISAINAFVTNVDLNLKEKLFHYNNEYGHLFNVYEKVLSLAMIPLLAAVIWLIHINKDRIRYSEYTVFAMILISLFTMVETVIRAINYVSTALTRTDVSIQDNRIYLILMIAYIAYADYQFHSQTSTRSWWKSALVGVAFFGTLFAIQLFMVYAFINGFQGLGHFEMYGIRIS